MKAILKVASPSIKPRLRAMHHPPYRGAPKCSSYSYLPRDGAV
ncbi:MAG: hypothetical protein ACTSUE_27280 [Promethearchaeota archaeon]